MKAREPVKDKSTIFETLKTVKESLLMLGVVSLGLFGSFVRGEQTEEGDIDFLVEFSEGNRTFDNLMELGFLLEDLLGRKVEVVTRQAMSPYILPEVLKELEKFHVAA
jgi:predicted nucleotidyltransferase